MIAVVIAFVLVVTSVLVVSGRAKASVSAFHGGAGFGKTTLLAQIAHTKTNTVWFSLAGENDVLYFINTLCEAIRIPFPDYDFILSEYLPFIDKENFITILANGLISSLERIEEDFMMIFDDLHTIKDDQIKKLIICFIKYMPKKMKLCLGSRETPWQELIPMKVRGNIFELAQIDLSFTRNEVTEILRFDDKNIFEMTEGWPLAIGSFKVLLENGVTIASLPSRGNEAMYSYLFYECISRLSPEMIDFLKVSAYFEELDAKMLDTVLNKKNTKLLLESLVSRNIFTSKIDNGHFRYHALFRECLLQSGDVLKRPLLLQKAAEYYLAEKQYAKAAEYAMHLEDKETLQKIILSSYKEFLKVGNYSELRVWFQALGNTAAVLNSKVLVAKGVFLSTIGNFVEAKKCLDDVIPLLKKDDKELYIDAMIHKARVLRNFISFEESNKLLDELITNLDDLASETAYAVVIEKLYNLCWNSQISEAYALVYQTIEACARQGNMKVKRWFERYLSAIHFFAGRMKESVYFYEKSLELPENERQYLEMHGIGIYAAKAYQMLGDRERSLSVLSDELQKLRSTGKYEEMWSGYLFAAEIHYQNTFIDKMNGENATYETTMKYFTLADEYAPLYRKTEFQAQWAKMQRLTYSLIFEVGPKDKIIDAIFENLDSASDYLKSIIFARLFGYFAAVSDPYNAVKCAQSCIEVGEKSNMLLHSSLAYGILARAAIEMKNQKEAIFYTKKYLELCYDCGIYEYFRMHKAYDLILAFAFDNEILPEITKKLMAFAGYHTKKIYIETLGGFTVYQYNDREKPIKMRTKRERELFAFLLDAGSEGVTKEQIYHAIWSESESEDIKNLIGVNLTQIKKDLTLFGIQNPVINREKHYSICMNEIECDFESFEKAAGNFKIQKSNEEAQKILSLYKGEYLSEFEALWATSKRIKYQEIYEKVLKYCL